MRVPTVANERDKNDDIEARDQDDGALPPPAQFDIEPQVLSRPEDDDGDVTLLTFEVNRAFEASPPVTLSWRVVPSADGPTSVDDDDETDFSTNDPSISDASADGADAADFGGTIPQGTLFFPPGRSPDREIKIPVTNDDTPEASEAFRVEVFDPIIGGDSFSGVVASATGVIVNDDGEAPAEPGGDGTPTADDDRATTTIGEAVIIDVLANDSDPEGNPLNLTSVSSAANGTTQITENGQVRFTPAEDFAGEAQFAYTVTDNQGLTDQANVEVTVSDSDFPSGQDDDVLNVQRGTVTGARGNDTFVLSDALADPNADIQITDTQGTNTLQFVGLTVASAQVASDTLQLTLDDGGQTTVLGASDFSYEVGGDPIRGQPGTENSFSDFVQGELGASVPDSGTTSNPNVNQTLGGTGEEANSIDLNADLRTDDGVVTGTEGTVERFEYEYDPAQGGQFTIENFGTGEDTLAFDLPGTNPALEADTLAAIDGFDLGGGNQVGVQVDQIAGEVVVNLGKNEAGDAISINLTGVTDPAQVDLAVA